MATTTELFERIVADIDRTLHGIDSQQISQLESMILKANQVFLVGKGRTGLQMKGFAMRLMHLGLKVHVIDDVTTPAIADGDLLIIGSGSGRTASLLRYAEICQQKHIPLALITGNPESSIAKMAQSLVVIPASNPKVAEHNADTTVLVMGSLFEHALGLTCDLIVIQLMAMLQQTQDEMNQRHANLE